MNKLKELYVKLIEQEECHYNNITNNLSVDYQFGFLLGLYNNKNDDLINAIDLIKEKLKTENFVYFVYSSFYFLVQNSIFDNLDRIKEIESDMLNMNGSSEYKNEYENLRKNKSNILKQHKESIAAHKSMLSNINIESIKNYFIDNLEKEKEVFLNWMKDEEFFRENFFLFKLFEITYDFYKYHNIEYESWTNYCKLNKFYISNAEDLWIDSNFSKYGLITIDSNYELLDSIQPRIYNKKLNISIILNGFIDTSLLKLLFSLKEKGVISILSLKPQYNIYLEGKIEHDLSLEAVQFGKLFDFTKLKDLVPTKLCNENKDVFWVNVNNCEMNFEEILYDFRVYKNQIITQVVHLIFYEENKNYYISHIDHEFIFYSYDEFDKKSKDIYQNGTAQKRHKTFKVDKSKIPFNEDNKPKFLLTVLYTFFYQKELINEYFEKYT